ncbi:glycosyltransferase family 2 protein [Denitromonas iodatirespirans]|uniref:Glycosyltransferase n=1 Tax=Denitromonas iodatirespirans TaxID=2795389 RepID=A0A944DBI7_DENI1|nr:glycosyltransferase [Denitromonas iodatirespirans]MBT0963464.1 glycosyltransferase [Denitromonas iodatirespirans]
MSPDMSHAPLVSIIVRTRNEERWIGLCLEAIAKQTYTRHEIILVDNRSTDRTVARARRYGVTLVEIDDFLPGKAINDGIRASRGEIIAIISGHCIPVDPHWLANLVARLDDPEIAGVYGRQEPLSFTPAADKRDLAITFGLDPRIQVKDSFFHNANSALRRDIWQRFPFDEQVSNIEDRVWGVEVIRAGLKIAYEPTASVYHYHGIHQDRDISRAQQIVQIMEGLHGPHADMTKIAEGAIRVAAIVPVRGNSLQHDGVSLLGSTIDYLTSCTSLTDIIVSTDCADTADLARRHGASVPFIRPAALSEKYVDIVQVLTYSLTEMEKTLGIFDLVVVVEETHPFRDPGMIDDMVSLALDKGFDTVLAAKPESRPVWLDGEHGVRQVGKRDFVPRALSEERAHLGLMGLGCVVRPALLRAGTLFGEHIGLHSVRHPLASVEIRTEEALQRCLPLLKHEPVA